MPADAAHMSPRNDLVARSAPFLPPGSQVRQAFICQSAPNFAFFVITYLTGLTMFWIRYRCVVVTQDAIYVLESSKPSGGGRPKSLVHKRFRREIAAADDDAGFTQSNVTGLGGSIDAPDGAWLGD